MKEETITVTEAARNFAEYVHRSHYQNTSFILLKNGKPVAKLVPAKERHSTGRELAEIIKNVALTPEEASDWNQDLMAARNSLQPPTYKWE